MATLVSCLLVGQFSSSAFADPPATHYIYPAGGQRGTTVPVRVGAIYLHEGAPFEMLGPGVEASPRIERTKTTWFEGPILAAPDSSRQEDYPKDYAGSIKISADAPLGTRAWRVWTSQGSVPARGFIIGDLPEIVEVEMDGEPIAVPVTLPVTANGRIFPREDIDIWSFEAQAGQSITCSVLATRLGSLLEPCVEIIGPSGQALAESSESSQADAAVRFTAPTTGVYQARIYDVRFSGMQSFVYRLTITAGPYVDSIYPLGGKRGTTAKFELRGQNVPAAPLDVPLPAGLQSRFADTLKFGNATSNLVTLDLDDLPEALEREPNGLPAEASAVELPIVLNGRIDRPGDIDTWSFAAKQGAIYEFDLKAARLGSPLDSVLIIQDATGKELARADDIGGNQTDSRLNFTAPAEGVYLVRIEERVASRGGPTFAYRLRIAPPAAPDFQLSLPTDALTLKRPGEIKLKVKVERLGAFADEIKLALENLPAGVTATNTAIPAKANEVDISLKAEATASIRGTLLKILGTAQIAGAAVTRPAIARLGGTGETEIEPLLLAVALDTPYKVKGVYEAKYSQRGSMFVRHFAIDRNGFNGPLEVNLGDKQMRHLQGVTGSPITVPAGVSEFDYPVFLPPWMELHRTSRSVVMAVGVVEEPDGSKHKISFTSQHQNEQIVVIVAQGELSVDISRKNVMVVPATSATLDVRIARGAGLNGPVTLELIVPEHIHGVTAQPVTIPPDQTTAAFTLNFAADRMGPFNKPLNVRATTINSRQVPVIAEIDLEMVVAK